MKALTLHQPWASFLFPGPIGPRLKRYETRSWGTNYRGRVAIHAGMVLSPAGRALLRCPDIMAALAQTGHPGTLEQYPRGVILGMVDLVACRHTKEFSPGPIERLVGDWGHGRLAWEMELAALLGKPIPARGFQGLWEWEWQPT